MTRAWSEQQERIFTWFRAGRGNLVVRARAGTGKTTTLLEGIRRAPESSILLCAFNRRIADELKARLCNPAAEAKTLHSIGLACVRRRWERIRIARGNQRAESLAAGVCGDRAPRSIVRLVARLHTRGRELAPFAREVDELRELAVRFDCVPDGPLATRGWDLDWIAAAALRAMERATRRPVDGIDFADMLYLPVRMGWLRARYDLVVVDEAQDMNPTQLVIARGVARGRLAVIGDDRQAIYAFRGADSGSLDRLKRELDATELGLTTTYRCGRSIVAEARRLVPDYRAADRNGRGAITAVGIDEMPGAAAPGDFVLSRKNAPLAEAALRILRDGKPARIEGRDLGAGLKTLIAQLAAECERDSMVEFLARLTAWRVEETERARQLDDRAAEARIERVDDQADTLVALAEGLATPAELQERVAQLFADRPRGEVVLCSTVHRAKGLEADRVFVLRDTLRPAVRCECGHYRGAHDEAGCDRCGCAQYCEDRVQAREEENIEYVAITRARSELVWVHG